jgi:hypothetical protein
MEVRSPTRTRTAHFVLRLNDLEREILDRVAGRLHMSASECMRYLIRRADEEVRPAATVEALALASSQTRKRRRAGP